jgi:threonine dehydratase
MTTSIQSIPMANDILKSHSLIKPFIHRTPVLTNVAINQIAECNIYFKCENFQKVGAFKMRGATNAISRLSETELCNGVATHSSGNHAAALALAAKIFGTKAHIVMPRNSPQVKKNAVLGYGAEIIECEPNLAARESTLQAVIERTNAIFIHPFDNYDVIAGQATAAKEFIDEIEGLNFLLAPVGGGGLLSGTVLSAAYFSPKTKVVGCEPEGADDAYQSLKYKRLIPQLNPNTIADGLQTSLSQKTFEIILDNAFALKTVDDNQIKAAMRLIWERMKIIVEPSSAVALAVVLNYKKMFSGKDVGIILSGGNVDFDAFRF